MCVCVCMQVPIEAPRVGVIGSCELPDIGADNFDKHIFVVGTSSCGAGGIKSLARPLSFSCCGSFRIHKRAHSGRGVHGSTFRVGPLEF